MRYFDFEKVAGEAKIPQEKLRKLSEAIRREFPKDDMMYELHIMRVCMSIHDGHVSIDDAIRTERTAQSGHAAKGS